MTLCPLSRHRKAVRPDIRRGRSTDLAGKGATTASDCIPEQKMGFGLFDIEISEGARHTGPDCGSGIPL